MQPTVENAGTAVEVHGRLEEPCQKPHQPLNLLPDQLPYADIESSNALLACLADLQQECWDFNNPQGGELCIDYAGGNAFEENGNTRLGFFITVEGTEFYDYTMYVPQEECEQAVETLRTHVRAKFDGIPAAGNLHAAENQVDVNGWTTGCLSEEDAVRILAATTELTD